MKKSNYQREKSLRFLNDKEREIKKYVDENGLNYRNEGEVAQIIDFYNSITINI